MAIYATNAEFDGIALNDIGLYIASFESADNGEIEYGGSITYNTSHSVNSNEWNYHGSHYEEPLSFKFQVICMDNKCSYPKRITPQEQAYYNRIFKRRDGYKLFRWLDASGYENIWYKVTIDIKWYKVAGEIMGGTFYVTCNAPNAYSDLQEYEITLENNQSTDIYDDSDMIGSSIIEYMEIIPQENGTIKLSNNLQKLYEETYFETNNTESYLYTPFVIDNCVQNEIIKYNGNTKLLLTNGTHRDSIMEDYNYSPIKLVNYDSITTIFNNITDENGNVKTVKQSKIVQNRLNTILNSGIAIKLKIAYRTKRTGVM